MQTIPITIYKTSILIVNYIFFYNVFIMYLFTDSSNVATTRGNKFALAFMPFGFNDFEITLFLTTEQKESNFTIETYIGGLEGFEQNPETGLYTRRGTAQFGQFTSILLGGSDRNITVRTNGDEDRDDRQKGFFIKADNSSDELTVYALTTTDTPGQSFMALSCQEFPTKNYEYFIFSAPSFFNNRGSSHLLITPCEDGTRITVEPSQVQSHPSWVIPNLIMTNPDGTNSTTVYNQSLNRFHTILLRNSNDLTGTIITSNRPLAVFAGYEFGSSFIDFPSSNFLVEQIPPHATYNNLFFFPNFASTYHIGSLSDDNIININCLCDFRPPSGRRVGISSSDRIHMVIINRGEYIECETPQSNCSMESTRPATVMSYHYIIASRPISMVYIPPVSSYLSQYLSLNFVEFEAFLDEFIFFASIQEAQTEDLFTNETGHSYLINARRFVNCTMTCNSSSQYVCGQTGNILSNQISSLNISSRDPFWGFLSVLFLGINSEYVLVTYSLPYRQVPTGCKFVVYNYNVANNIVCMHYYHHTNIAAKLNSCVLVVFCDCMYW